MVCEMKYLCRLNKPISLITQIPLVLRLVIKVLAAHLDFILLGVVPRTRELLQLELLGGCKAEIGRTEGDDDFAFSRVRFAHVGSVAEAENFVFLGWLKRLCQLCGDEFVRLAFHTL